VIRYGLAGSVERVLIEDDVLEQFGRYRQIKRRAPEAGGQLFARLEPPYVVIAAATGPDERDKRSRFSFRPDLAKQQLEIKAMYERGLHYVGDWHTHPAPRGSASGPDFRSIGEVVRLSRHGFGAFLLIVAGTAPPPDGLAVYLHDGQRAHELTPMERREDMLS